MTEHSIEPGHPHPPGPQQDLNPEFMAGQNQGLSGPHPEKDARTAYDVKELHRALHDFTDDQLKQIPVLAGGTRLEQGATYIDLRGSEPREFTATADMAAGPGDWYVPKTEVPYDLWNRLLAVGNRETGGGRGQAA